MRIIGIDPGLQRTGYACLEVGGGSERLVEAGVLRTVTAMPLEKRLMSIASDFAEVVESFGPGYAAVEELYSHYDHPTTSILMGHARGVILHVCAQKDVVVKSFSATKIKKSLTGNGHATKEQMQRTIQILLGLEERPEPNDVADAIAAALCCANQMARNAVTDYK